VPKLNQIIAVEKGTKSRTQRELTDVYHRLQKPALLSGISRTYQPNDDEGETLPPESTKVQVRTEDVLREAGAALSKLFDVVATKDWANCEARADVTVDGQAVLRDVPVTYLLFLEKQLTDLQTLIGKLPVLDAAETWTFDESSDVWRTEPVRTTRTKKVPRAHVLFSGAMPARRVNELRERVERLLAAVKYAREEANGIEVTDQRVGDAVFRYLFA
jgi:hypothetical protein